MTTPETADRTSIWIPRYDVEVVETIGDGESWPSILVTKWEENQIGERRHAGSRMYQPPNDAESPDP